MALFSVQTVIKFDDLYEERVVLFTALDFDDALQRADAESHSYVEALGSGQVLGLQQVYQLDATEIADGAEVFSLMRTSELGADEYLSRHFETGTEHEEHL